jgi:PilZ domain
LGQDRISLTIVAAELPLPQDGRDKRVAPRYRVLGHAQIIGRTGAINCVVRDLSDTGAKLGVSSQVRLPAEFDLRFVRRRLTLRVRIRWRAGEYVGVAFCEPEKAPKAARPAEQHMLDV